MTKKVLAFVLALTTCFSMAACNSGTPASVSSDAASDPAASNAASEVSSESAEPVTIQFWTDSLKPTFTDFITGLITKYQDQNKNVTVNWQDLPDDALQNKLVTAIASDTAPDVVDSGTTLMGIMAGKGALVALDEEASEEQRSVYLESLLKSNIVNDHLYAFPWYATPNVAIYNKDLFAKAGLTSTPKTYDELFEMSKVMKEKTGAYLLVPTKVSVILLYNNIPILTEDKTKAAFNTPEAEALLQKFVDGCKAGYINKTDWNGWDKNLQMYSTGNLAMLNTGSQSVKRIKDEAPNIYPITAVGESMLGSNGLTYAAVESLSIPVKSKNHEEAIKFASYVTNDENELAFCKLVSIFPTTKTAAADPFFTSDTTTLEGQASAQAAKVIATSAQLTLDIDQGSAILKEVDNLFGAIISRGTPVKQALAEEEAKVNQMLAQK